MSVYRDQHTSGSYGFTGQTVIIGNGSNSLIRVCGYCGSQKETNKCPECGGSRDEAHEFNPGRVYYELYEPAPAKEPGFLDKLFNRKIVQTSRERAFNEPADLPKQYTVRG